MTFATLSRAIGRANKWANLNKYEKEYIVIREAYCDSLGNDTTYHVCRDDDFETIDGFFNGRPDIVYHTEQRY